jgi:hypothetical protein
MTIIFNASLITFCLKGNNSQSIYNTKMYNHHYGKLYLPSDKVFATKLQSQINKNNYQYYMDSSMRFNLVVILFALLVSLLYIILIKNFP